MKKYVVVTLILLALIFVSYGEKDWVWINLICASNNLESAGIDDINEMEVYGSNDNMDIIVVLDRIRGYDSSNDDWTGAKILYIEKDNDLDIVNSKVIKDLGEINFGDVNEVKKVVGWIIEKYPSEKLALTLWDHGSGPLIGNPVIEYNKDSRGSMYDDESGNNLSNANLSDLAKFIYNIRKKKTNIFEYDMCLMGMLEVAYETMDYVKLSVFSEETEPGDGNDYTSILKEIQNFNNLEDEYFGKIIVDTYVEQYKYSWGKITKSMISDKQTQYITDAFEELIIYTLKDNKNTNLWKEAISKSEHYAYSFIKDLYSLMVNLQDLTNDETIIKKAQFVKNEIENIYDRQNDKCEYSKGIAIYAPTSKYKYNRKFLSTVRFGQDTSWIKVLDNIFE